MAGVNRLLARAQEMYPSGGAGAQLPTPGSSATPTLPAGASGLGARAARAGSLYQRLQLAAADLDQELARATAQGGLIGQQGRGASKLIVDQARVIGAQAETVGRSPAGARLIIAAMDQQLAAMHNQLNTTKTQNQAVSASLRHTASEYQTLSNGAKGSPTEPPSHSGKPNGHIQAAGHGWKQAPDQPDTPTDGQLPEPVSRLGLPNYTPGSLPDEEARTVYLNGELRMRELNEQLIKQGLNAEQRAKIMFEQRNALRTWIRDISSNRADAEGLNKSDPNMSWEQVKAKYQAQGLTGDDLYNTIVERSTASRASVNQTHGLDPEHPPPLPPIRPSPSSTLPNEPPVPKPHVTEPPAPRSAGPPAEGGGKGFPLPGGPSIPFGPHVIPPPHAHKHWPTETPEDEWNEGPASQH